MRAGSRADPRAGRQHGAYGWAGIRAWAARREARAAKRGDPAAERADAAGDRADAVCALAAAPAVVHTGTPAPAAAATPAPPPVAPAVVPEVPAVEPLAGSPSARALLHAVATAPVAPAPKARDAGGQADYELKDLQASQFFLDCMDNNGHVRPLKDARRHPEADGVLNALKAMASPEETQVLQIRGRDAGQQGHAVAVAEQVVRHLVSRLLREYADKNDTKTSGRLAKSTVYFNTLDKHLKSSKLNISSRAFQAWRADPKESPYRGADGSDACREAPCRCVCSCN